MGVTLVSETLGLAVRSTGSLAGTWFDVVAVETNRAGARRAREVRRARTNIVGVEWGDNCCNGGGEVGDVELGDCQGLVR